MPIIIMTALVMFSACGRKPGKITSSSRYVTPMMIEQLQKKLEAMPAPETENAANEILKADVLSAFKSDDKKGDSLQEENKNQKNVTEAEKTEVAEGENPEEKKPQPEQDKPLKPESESNKTQIAAVENEETVYVSKNGKKFHKTPDCSGMKSPVAMTRSEAENDGKTYCKKCYE